MFLATNGERLGATWLTGQVHRYVEASGDGQARQLPSVQALSRHLDARRGSGHPLRPGAARAPRLASTHIYTRVAPERLAAVHAATHPGAALPGHGHFPL